MGQKRFGIEVNQLTSIKSQKTCSVSARADSTRWARGPTPRFSSLPGVLDLRKGEKIARRVRDERYLVGKRQNIIVVIEYLHSPRVVLSEGVTGESFDSVTNPHTLVAILSKVVVRLGLCKSG